MQNSEVFKTPKGVIDMFGHKGRPTFVQVGEGANQGYLIIPKENIIREEHLKNLIVNKASVLMAKRMVPGVSWGAGIGYLELGTGVGTGTTQAPQVESPSQTALRLSLVRKAITAWTYVDANDNPTGTPTNRIRYTTNLGESEAVGALVEQALFGGDATSTRGSGYMFNYKTFKVWNKDDTMELTIAWTLTF